MSEPNSERVYSTDGGPAPPRPAATRRPARPRSGADGGTGARGRRPADPGDGVVRLHRGKPARGGKQGTLVVGLPGSEAELDALLRLCKQRIGTGGTRQGRVLLIQGDHREALLALLEAEGHGVKLAGG